jgi:hypothetical protein
MTRHGGRPTFHIAKTSRVGTKRARDPESSSTDADNFVRVSVLPVLRSVPSMSTRTEVLMSLAVKLPHLHENA